MGSGLACVAHACNEGMDTGLSSIAGMSWAMLGWVVVVGGIVMR